MLTFWLETLTLEFSARKNALVWESLPLKQEDFTVMMEANIKPMAGVIRWNKSQNIVAILIILLVIGIIYSALQVRQSGYLPEGTVIISQADLEETYGLRVNLVAVTAAGGLVDVRLKIVDGEKAKTLLGDPKNFPSLMAGNGIILHTSEDFAKQEIKFDKDSNLFIMFSNPQSLIKPGTPVTILFGNIALEAISSR